MQIITDGIEIAVLKSFKVILLKWFSFCIFGICVPNEIKWKQGDVEWKKNISSE